MSDIVERLRDWRDQPSDTAMWRDCAEAADEIERLRAEVAGLREDAERYRLIREEMTIERAVSEKGKRGLMAWWTGIGVESGSDEHIDAAIDAARKGEA